MEEFTITNVIQKFGDNQNIELLNNFSQMNQPLVFDYLSNNNNNFLNNNNNNNNNNNTNKSIYEPPYSLQPFSNLPESCSSQHTFSSTDQDHLTALQSSPAFHTINSIERKKRKRKESEKPKEVIHVRAKRGQATDSHSLAERVRRERINEKLKLLQDLVPGCYKTMGMAVMLDVIINYVQSLQNQIEFLSMKLSAASMFYDFNSPEAEAIDETLQRTINPCDANLGRMMREGYEGTTLPSVHSSWPF
ncbi:unnamed protein product [Amaranthus hypochondriacus]